MMTRAVCDRLNSGLTVYVIWGVVKTDTTTFRLNKSH